MRKRIVEKFKKFCKRRDTALQASSSKPGTEAGFPNGSVRSHGTIGYDTTSQASATLSLGDDAQAHVPLLAGAVGPQAEESQPATYTAPQSSGNSHRLWNLAYDRLADPGEDTAELVQSYIKILSLVLDTQEDSFDVSAEMNDPIKRQIYMRSLVEKGRDHISTSSKFTKGVGDAARFILSAKDMISIAIQKVPQAALPWAGVCIGLQILLNPAKATRSNLAGIAHVTSRMDWYCALTDQLLNRNNIVCGQQPLGKILESLEETIITLYKALLLYQMRSVCSYYRNRFSGFVSALANIDDWDSDLKRVMDAESKVQTDANQYIQVHTKTSLVTLVDSAEEMKARLGDLHQDLQTLILQQMDQLDDKITVWLQGLFVEDPRDVIWGIESRNGTLLDDAFQWILLTKEYVALTDWSSDQTRSGCLLWIKGPAGTGKTMLMIGIIRELLSSPAVLTPGVSQFFFQSANNKRNSATAALRSLLWQLFVQQPHLIRHLPAKYKYPGGLHFSGDTPHIALFAAFQKILADPDLLPTYMIVDALDECAEGRESLIKLISTSLSCSKVKWLVSSRPEVGLDNSSITAGLLALNAQSLIDPVSAYIDHKLHALRGRGGYDDHIIKQIGAEVRRRAMNIFLWAALAFKQLELVNGWDAVDEIKKMPEGLSSLYDIMMARIETLNDWQYCRKVLATTLVAHRPLSLAELSVLAGLPNNVPVRDIVDECGSFYTVEKDTVSLIHQSAKDYLEENFTKVQPEGVVQEHSNIIERSIEAISQLGKDIYDLKDFDFRPEDALPPDPDPLAPLQYSCLFWVDHVCAIIKSPECAGWLADDGRVLDFLKKHFLYWLESLSLLRKLMDGYSSIQKLLLLPQTKSTKNPHIARFLDDAESFIHTHWWLIEGAPLQIYRSALVFSPTTSEVRNLFWDHRTTPLKQVLGIRDCWGPREFWSAQDNPSAHRQTLIGHKSAVSAVAFSPDGSVIASASLDKTIQIWDAATGAYRQTLTGHEDMVMAVAFSPDCMVMVSASYDKTIRVWDAATGAHRQTLIGHKSGVTVVAFSPDGMVMASASDDKTVRVWDAATGAHRHTLIGHEDRIMAVAFSPDGMVMASASEDKTIRVWDTATGAHRQTLIGHEDRVMAVAFSPDGMVMASVSYDKKIRVWDTATGAHRQTFIGQTLIFSVAFSRDGRYVVTKSGLFEVSSMLWPCFDNPVQSPRARMSVAEEWVYVDGKKHLWLPTEYGAMCDDVFSHTIVLGHLSGGLTIFQLPEE